MRNLILKFLGITCLILSLSACTLLSGENHNPEVNYKGALKNIMRKGDLSAQGNMKDLEGMDNLYALGAVENLKGEILILNGKPYVSSKQDDSMVVSNTFDHKATLLVYASVEKWNSFEVPEEVYSYEDLEKYVEQLADENGLNTNFPFPFLLKGMANSFDWHVIDWPEGDTEHSHEKHITSGLHGTQNNKEVEIFGFYSDSHHAIFTHHTTNMHLHVKTTDNEIIGHVDGLVLGKGMTILLPVDHLTGEEEAAYERYPYTGETLSPDDFKLRTKGYIENTNWIAKEFVGAKHHEDDWNRRLHIPLEFLLKDLD